MEVTVLKSLGPVLAKRITPHGVSNYDDAAYFHPFIHEVDDLAGFGVLLDEIRKIPTMCYVRGIPVKPELVPDIKFKDGKPAFNDAGAYRRKAELFTDTATHLLCIDADDADARYEGLKPWEMCVAWITENLPPEFHRVTFLYQLSSSFGIKPGLRAHLWFWLDKPINSFTAREWGKAWNEKFGRRVIDTSIYTPVTPHYTADPIVEDPFGMYDLPADTERTGLCQSPVGKHTVHLQEVTLASGNEFDAAFSELTAKDTIEAVTVDLAREYLAKIPNGAEGESQDYDTWLKVGAALHHQFGEEGRELWHEWSQQSERYDADDLDRRFDSFSESRGQAATFASIIHLAGGKIVDQKSEDLKYQIWTERIDAEVSPIAIMKTIIPELISSDIDFYLREILLERCRARLKRLTGSTPKKKMIDDLVMQARADEENRLRLHLEFRMADAVLDRYYAAGAHVKFINGAFWEFSTKLGCWNPLPDESAIKGRIQAYIRELLAEDSNNATDLSRLLGNNEDRATRVAALTSTLCEVISNQVSESDIDPLGLQRRIMDPAVNCSNGTLQLDPRSGELLLAAHDPSQFLTHALPCRYDPEATCPTWDAAVEKVWRGVPNAQAQIDAWYEFWGYVIIGSRAYGEAFGMMQGPGGNGKSFLIEILMVLLGYSAMTASLADLAVKPASPHFEASLVGKLAIIDDDFKTHGKLPDEHLKRYSGHKIMTANPKFGATYNFTCRSMCFILTNSWPSTADLSEGIRRRAHIWEVTYILKDEDKDPMHRTIIINKELPGVLNRLIAGAQRVIRRGRLQMTQEMQHSRERWLNSGSTVSRFAKAVLIKTPWDEESVVSSAQLFQLYKFYTGHFEDIKLSLGRNRFYEALRELGYTDREGTAARRQEFYGLRINEAFVTQMKEEVGGIFEL